uniref:Ycf20-like protein n=1 Tax=Kalanchoe fedtschenkoi TaxID=63787 RepID=A0A7N0ZTA3_KALFE
MAWTVGTALQRSTLLLMENETFDKSCYAKLITTGRANSVSSNSSQSSSVVARPPSFSMTSFLARRKDGGIAFALNTGGIPENGEEQNLSENSGLGSTRLGRIVSAGGRQLLDRLNNARKNFPMKIFLLLLGFYTANALATILGQTGDWDVLVAGIVVAAIEGIGALVYKKPPSIFVSTRRFQSLIVMVNYWKAGLCLGLFVDAFKLGS